MQNELLKNEKKGFTIKNSLSMFSVSFSAKNVKKES